MTAAGNDARACNLIQRYELQQADGRSPTDYVGIFSAEVLKLREDPEKWGTGKQGSWEAGKQGNWEVERNDE